MDDILTALPAGAVDAIPDLCRRFHVRRLDLFGSAADGRFDRARSDFDLLVAFEDLPDHLYPDTYFDLREALVDLLGREVDLLTESALENPYLRRQIAMQRLQLFPPV
jgi:predicted nucleotidyltransferase